MKNKSITDFEADVLEQIQMLNIFYGGCSLKMLTDYYMFLEDNKTAVNHAIINLLNAGLITNKRKKGQFGKVLTYFTKPNVVYGSQTLH